MQVPKLSKTIDNFWIYNIKREVISQSAKLGNYVFTLPAPSPVQLPGKEFEPQTQCFHKNVNLQQSEKNFTFEAVKSKVINGF